MTNTRASRRTGERGIALVITMFLMASLSALAVSLMFLSNTETAATRNYRTMSQARYGGEAAVHAAMNYLMSSAYTSTVPVSPFTGYGTSKSPVTCTSGCTHTAPTSTCDASSVATAVNTGCIVLSGISGISSNYPNTTVATAFSTAAQGTLATNSSGVTNNAAHATVNYGAAAILLSMQQVSLYGGTTAVLQTWQVVGDGTVPGAVPATIEVTATLEHGVTSAETYAIFAGYDGCGAITMAGNEVTDSYDSSSSLGADGKPVISASGGAVGTNGNLDLSGNVTVNGTLTTPRTGVGSCTAGNITAETTTGRATVSGGTINLPQAKTWSDPSAPSPTPATTSLTINTSTTCLQIQAALSAVPGGGGVCTGSAGNFTITANGASVVLPNVSLSGGARLTIAGGSSSTVNFNVNSFTMSGNSILALGSSTSVVMNVAGQGIDSTGTVLDFTGGSLSTGSFDPSKFQILYAGTAHMDMTGNSGSSAMVYAPDAQFTMHGTTDFYGSVLARTFTDTGGATVHFDRSLSSKFQSLGNYVLTSFTWKKY